METTENKQQADAGKWKSSQYSLQTAPGGVPPPAHTHMNHMATFIHHEVNTQTLQRLLGAMLQYLMVAMSDCMNVTVQA